MEERTLTSIPDPPEHLRADSITPNSAYLRWNPRSPPNGKVSFFEVGIGTNRTHQSGVKNIVWKQWWLKVFGQNWSQAQLSFLLQRAQKCQSKPGKVRAMRDIFTVYKQTIEIKLSLVMGKAHLRNKDDRGTAAGLNSTEGLEFSAIVENAPGKAEYPC